jgi:hypothetical protein
MRLVLPDNGDEAPVRLDITLIKAIARGYTWYEQLISRDSLSVEALADGLGLSKRYVNRVIRCALIAPDLVERLLDGSQPPDVTLDKLFCNIPADWPLQRQLFRISAYRE